MANPFEGNQFALKLGYHLNKFDDPKGSGHISRSPGRGNRSPRGESHSPLPPSDKHQIPEKPSDSLSTRSAAESFFPDWQLPRNVADVEPLKDKIRVLEATVTEYEQHKVNVIKTFGEYRERVAERERKLEAEYSTKIVKLSDDVLAAKKDFEERMKSFQALQEKFENEKETALEKLKSEHQKEIQLLAQRCSESQLHNLEQKYMIEIQRLEEERKSLKSERAHLGQAFESKLRRAQTLYEKELIEAKSLYSKELEALKDHEDNLKEELLARQDEFRDQLEQLQMQFQQSKEELSKCGREVAELEKRLEQKEAECRALSLELEAARAETEEALKKLRSSEEELGDTKQKQHELEQQYTIKQNLLTKLETTKAKLEALIQDLQVEVRSLKNKVAFLENERKNLESQGETQAQLQNSQVQALEAVLENLTREKDATKDHFEHLLEQERIHAEEREYGLKKEYTTKLHEVEKENKNLHETLELMTTDDKAMIRKRLADDYEKRLKDQQAENKSLEDEVESLRDKLHRVLQTGADTSEPAKIRKEISSSEVSLKKCQSQLSELIAKSGSVSRELDHAKNEIAEKDGKIEKLQGELKQLNSKFSQTESGAETPQTHVCDFYKDHEEEINSLQEGIKRNFETEKKQIKKDLEKKFERRNMKALAELENSFKTKQEEYEREIRDLKTEIARLQSEMGGESRDLEGSTTESTAQGTVRELNQTITELNSTVEELHARISELQEQNVEDLRIELDQKEKDREELASLLADTKAETDRLLEEKDAKIKQLTAQIKDNKKSQGLSQQDQKKQREEIERELRSKFAEAAAENHVHEVEAFEKQLQVIKEQADEKEKELETAMKNLRKDMSKKDLKMENLESHVQELLQQIEDLNTNLEGKAEEIKHFNKKTDEYIRKREQQQVQAHSRKILSLKSEHEAELEKLKEREAVLLKDLESLRNNSKEKEAEEVTGKIQELQEQVAKKEEMIDKLQQGSTGSSETTSNKESPTSSMHSDSRKPSISSGSGGPPLPPGEKPLCRKAANMALVHRWQCLVHQLTTDTRNTRRPSTDAKAAAAGSPTPTTDSELCERQGRPLSRSTPTASTSSLKPPEENQRSGKSPTRPGFLKPKTVALDKRPAWRF